MTIIFKAKQYQDEDKSAGIKGLHVIVCYCGRQETTFSLLLIVHVLLSGLKLVCSLSRRSHLHYLLCLHLSWSPGINPHLCISSVGADPSAAPHRQTPRYSPSPNHQPPRPELIFISKRKIKTPTCKSRDEERRRGGGSCRGRKEKGRESFSSVNV